MNPNTHYNRSYVGPRPDIQALIPPDSRAVLDLGCSAGVLGDAIKKQNADVMVVGIEFDPDMAQTAEQSLDKVFCGDIETFDWSLLGDTPFDCVVCADILEHLRDPWSVFAKAVEYLTPEGRIIVSVPNIRHISSLYSVYARGVWPVKDRGIHDRTHLRFFTLRSIRDLYGASNCQVEFVSRNYRIVEKPYYWLNAIFSKLHLGAVMNWIPILREFFTYQYVVSGKKPRGL